MGTTAERAAATTKLPGHWIDANTYGNYYALAGGAAYHTGSDFNLNYPSWDFDRGLPALAAASGVVTFAAKVPAPSTWGRVVVIRHGESLFSRYAHLATLQVIAGQAVTRGQLIGLIGGAEFGLPNHLHFDISTTKKLLTNPMDWPGLMWSRIVLDYVNPVTYVIAHKSVVAKVLAPEALRRVHDDRR